MESTQIPKRAHPNRKINMGFIGAAIVKNMFWQNFKKIIVFVAVFNLSACSVVGDLWYERIDQFIANQLFEYAKFFKRPRRLYQESRKGI
ncbi:MAG: hypothetical protein Ct9H300mP4_12880 [Gammaproteobacteria bacterium]|nr:MAG: hypothetical protein Ct9H300mP4_12880 [Gammaproteobacteria bacterium]